MDHTVVDRKRVGIYLMFAFGIAGIYVFFTQGTPNALLGPSAAGLIGSWALAVVAMIIFFQRDTLTPRPE